MVALEDAPEAMVVRQGAMAVHSVTVGGGMRL